MTIPTDEHLDRIVSRLWPDGFGRDVWMILDCARDQRIYGMMLHAFYSQNTCLYVGPIAPELQAAAPYLIQLDYHDTATREFLRSAWANAWGVFLRCGARMEIVARHLRSLLVVENEAGHRLLFRYYDPRILRAYLPTCTPRELGTVFGPIDWFLLEDGEGDALLEFRVERDSLVSSKHVL